MFNSPDINLNKTATLFQIESSQPYMDKSMAGLLYEIFERARYSTLLDSYNSQTIIELANNEFDNLQKILEEADNKAQEQVTKRWESDMQSDSVLSKNIRPLVLIYLTVIFTACAFFHGNVGEFKIAEEYIPIFQTLLVTVYGAYFVGRTWEKAKKITNKKD